MKGALACALLGADSHNELVHLSLTWPDVAFAYRGLKQGVRPETMVMVENEFETVWALETYAGVVYRRKMLDALTPPAPTDACFTTDDLVLGDCVRRNGYQLKTVAGNRYGQGGNAFDPIEHVDAAQRTLPLSADNMGARGRNEQCWQQLWLG